MKKKTVKLVLLKEIVKELSINQIDKIRGGGDGGGGDTEHDTEAPRVPSLPPSGDD